MCVGGGVFWGPSPNRGPPHTQTSYAGATDVTRQRATVVLYNNLFSRTIVTRCHGGDVVYLPWGKGLNNGIFTFLCGRAGAIFFFSLTIFEVVPERYLDP